MKTAVNRMRRNCAEKNASGHRSARERMAGFTLIEFLIAMLLFLVIGLITVLAMTIGKVRVSEDAQ